jgi:cytochrome d ubiquinol oxidase subunit II
MWTLLKPKFIQGIWLTGIGTVATVLALLLIAGWNNTAYYPSTADLQSSLTISNSSSSLFTLQVMSIVSLLIPFVLWYIYKAWKAINGKQIDAVEMNGNDMKY